MPLNELIPIINKLQEAFAPLGIAPIDLPQIAVVGSQSSGKSSVLEALVGYDFLPRGTGICTRRPLILQLLNEDVEQDWAEFAHSSKKLYSFDEVKRTIESETAKVAGTGKSVSSEPIILRVHSRNVVDLTLVDLPGLTKVPVGDQPQDIAEVIHKMVMEVIERPNCIILAVSAANQDIANSDGLQLARLVDPNGERTVGVLTKLDIMDAGTDARDVLEGRTYPLRHGYIGVVNRSQRDIDQGKSMMASMASEKKFFETHPAYSRVAHEQGSGFLSKRLNSLLEGHIRQVLPDISKKAKAMLREASEELTKYGDGGAQTSREQRAHVVSAIQGFCEDYKEAVLGVSRNLDDSRLYGSGCIREIFTSVFPDEVRQIDAKSELTDDDIHIVRRNAVGVKADLFVPNAAFETLVKRLIQKLEDPAATCVRLVSEQIKQVIQDVMRTCKEIGRYEHLKERVWQECMKLLGDKQREAAEFVQNIINMEVAYLNTDNPEFDTFRSGVYRLMAAHQGMAAAGGASEGSAGDRAAQPKPEAPAPDVTREGMVDAWVREKWKAHFVRIGTDRQLSLYVNKSDLTPIRSNALEECTVRQDAALGKTCLEISLMKRGWLSNGQETIRLRFASAEDAAAWSKSFQAASAAAREDEEERPESPRSSAAPGGGRGRAREQQAIRGARPHL
mmetsp:Transcript_26133/g.60319  ORF Transcript_26133/g.60319 Transcript_26133/m.60319 type:complete len:676 (-) Transcript_26133:628-2655(-)